MSSYKCIKDFQSKYHMKDYKVGFVILKKEYNELFSTDQLNFELMPTEKEQIESLKKELDSAQETITMLLHIIAEMEAVNANEDAV